MTPDDVPMARTPEDSAVGANQTLVHFPETLACCQQAVTLAQQGRLQEAEEGFLQALRINPDYADAHNNLGNVLKDLGHRLKP